MDWDTIYKLVQGNMGALNIVLEIDDMESIEKLYYVDILKSYDLVGSKLYMLYADCCDKDFNKFLKNLIVLKSGVFSKEFVDKNLGLVHALPMVDDEILNDKVVKKCIISYHKEGSLEELKRRLTANRLDNVKVRQHLKKLKKDIEQRCDEEGPSGFGS